MICSILYRYSVSIVLIQEVNVKQKQTSSKKDDEIDIIMEIILAKFNNVSKRNWIGKMSENLGTLNNLGTPGKPNWRNEYHVLLYSLKPITIHLTPSCSLPIEATYSDQSTRNAYAFC